MTFRQLLQQAKQLVEEKNISEAKSLYYRFIERLEKSKSTVDLKPEEKSELAIVYNNLGQLKYLQVDFEGAVQDYDRAIANDSKLASAYYNRGTISYRLGKFDKALQDMLMATHFSPHNEEFKVGLERTKSIVSTTNINSTDDVSGAS